MICGGDELAWTQSATATPIARATSSPGEMGAQDDDRATLEFTRALAKLRREHPTFRRRKFFRGARICGSEVKDLAWIRPTAGL